MRQERKLPPVVRIPPKTGADAVIASTVKVSVILLGIVGAVAILKFGRPILVPITLAIVTGLMLGPYADRLERVGLPPSLSSLFVVITLLALIAACIAGFAVPMGNWASQLPLVWERLREILIDWRGAVQSVTALGEQLRSLTGGAGGVTVKVDDGGPAADLAFLAPGLLGQLLVFLAALYFFIATRHDIRVSILRLCISRRLRWRAAHVFRDVEAMVSSYLVSITLINIGLGAAVSLAMFLIGVPSPVLWGLLAAALNYVIYVGPAAMALILLGVGLASFTAFPAVLAPAGAYLFLNFIEAQFVTPHVLGRRLTINPFLVFLALVFWLWIWGPAGGFVAVPLLLVAYATITNIVPTAPRPPQ